MPELKGRDLKNFSAVDIDTASIPYKDKAREKQRQLNLQERNEAEQCFKPRNRERKAVNTSWSKKKQRTKKKEMKKKRNSVKEIKVNRLKRKMEKLNEDEMDDLAKEARLVKRLKSRKISQAEFEQQINDDDIN